MKTIASRDLRARLGAILEDVRDHRAEYVVTQHGKVVARIVPEAAPTPRQETFEEVWADLDELAEQTARIWPQGLSAVDAVRAVRRGL
jgi:prevent-host-death family protein